MLNKLLFVLVLLLAVSFSDSIVVTLPPSICNTTSGILTAITNIPQCTAEAIFTSLTNGLIYSAQQFYNFSISFLTASPDINWFCVPFTALMEIIQSFYSIMLMGLGAYYILNAADVEGRTKAKIWLKNVFFMIIFLTFSFAIFGILIDLNTQISSSIYASVSTSLFNINATLSDLIFSLIFALSLNIGGWLTFSTLIPEFPVD